MLIPHDTRVNIVFHTASENKTIFCQPPTHYLFEKNYTKRKISKREKIKKRRKRESKGKAKKETETNEEKDPFEC